MSPFCTLLSITLDILLYNFVQTRFSFGWLFICILFSDNKMLSFFDWYTCENQIGVIRSIHALYFILSSKTEYNHQIKICLLLSKDGRCSSHLRRERWKKNILMIFNGILTVSAYEYFVKVEHVSFDQMWYVWARFLSLSFASLIYRFFGDL